MNNMIRVLYLDDNPLDRDLVRHALEVEHSQFDLTITASRPDFETALTQGNFDLILSDFNIPGYDGLQVIELVHAKDPTLPMVVVTGTGSERIAVEAMKLGAADYVIKTPDHIRRLPLTLHTVLEKQQAELSLRESEERFRLLFLNSGEAILLTNPDGTIHSANPEACRIFGRTEEELKRLDQTGIVDTTDPRLPIALEERWRTGSFKGELNLVRKDGTIFPAELTATLFKDSGGQERTSMIIRDISEWLRSKMSLLDMQERVKGIIDSAMDAIISIDDSQHIILFNPAAEAMFGCKQAEALGQPIERFLPERFRAGHAQHIRNFSQAGVTSRAMGRLGTVYGLRSNGEEFPIEASISKTRTSGGELYTVILRDITERKQAEEALRQFKDVIDSSNDAIYMIDGETGRYVDFNLIAYESLGYARDELLQRKIMDVAGHIPDLEAWRERVDQIYSKNHLLFETVYRRKDGSLIPVEVNAKMLRLGDQPILLAVARNITERKRAEEQLLQLNAELEERVQKRTTELNRTNAELEYANRAKDEFLATMSHELRTPLNSILGFSENLLEKNPGPLNEKQEQYVGLIHSSGQHLLNLINDILQVSKIEAGKMDIYPDTVFVREICESSLNFIREAALKKSISLEYVPEPSIATVHADPQRLKQILVNLLSNAVKFTPQKGKVSLTVHINAEEDRIYFSIIDNGIGIAREDLEKLFAPFTQLDSHLSRQYEGTGLGLVIVYKLAELHGGSVEVESKPGIGSRFTVILPWSRNETDLNRNVSSHIETTEPSSPLSGRQARILLAEDSESNILTIQEYLSAHGYEVIVAHNGLEAIAMAEKFSPQILLMDVQMPEMDGLEAIRRLRADPKFASVPIIALTALAMPGDRERCLAAGANEYMSKPARLKTLATMIRELLESPK